MPMKKAFEIHRGSREINQVKQSIHRNPVFLDVL